MEVSTFFQCAVPTGLFLAISVALTVLMRFILAYNAEHGERWAAVVETFSALEFRIHILIRQLVAGASESWVRKKENLFISWKTVLPDQNWDSGDFWSPKAGNSSLMATRGANVIWFRHGLRLHDNPALLAALADKDQGIALIPVFIFDGESAGKNWVFENLFRCAHIHVGNQIKLITGNLELTLHFPKLLLQNFYMRYGYLMEIYLKY